MSALDQAEGCCAWHSVRQLERGFTQLLMGFFLKKEKLIFNDFGYCRHVKGRVLVGLSDGTLVIFHRGVGKNPAAFNLSGVKILYSCNCVFLFFLW